MTYPKKFAALLRQGIEEIQKHESKLKKKFLKDIYNELSQSISRQPSTIDYYLRGNVPTALYELERLAREVFTHGVLNKEWLTDFLQSGGHPHALSIVNDLLDAIEPQPDSSQDYTYKRTTMVVVRKMLPDRRCYTEAHVEVEVVGHTDLEFVRHLSWAIDMPMYEKIKLEFQPLNRDGKGYMKEHILRDIPGIFAWKVDFLPPLKMGQKASYVYKYYIDNFYPWTYEDCEKLYEAGEMMKKYATMRYCLLVPVDDFQMRIEFPPHYPISLPSTSGFGVYFSLSDDVGEKTRLITENSFSTTTRRSIQQWTMELRVKKARPNLSYELQWFPPRENQLQ